MLKFMVVAHRRRDWSREQFRRSFQEVHGALALAIPGVRRYVQNFTVPGERRQPPCDAVIEFWFDDTVSMEEAWRSAEGRRATADNANCMDMERTAWCVVDEVVVLRRLTGRTPGISGRVRASWARCV